MTLDTAWLALCLQQRIGSKTLKALIAHFGTPEDVLAADIKALKTVSGVGAKIAASIRTIDLTETKQQLQHWQNAGVQILLESDAAYPTLLKTLDDAPPVLFVDGLAQKSLFDKAAAIIGTRNPSPEARETAFRLGQRLATQGYTIVSGLAKGIDTAAHEGALTVKHGKTIAITGSGVLNVYPPENQGLAIRIRKRGCLISESAPDATPNAARLVARNRLITGISQHVFVVETAIDGGAMHAARFARQQNRKLYTCTFPESGNLQLLRDGITAIIPDLSNFSPEAI